MTLQRFTPTRSSPRAEHRKSEYYFAAVENRDAFLAEPARYATVPHYLLGETRKEVEERERKRREQEAAENEAAETRNGAE